MFFDFFFRVVTLRFFDLFSFVLQSERLFSPVSKGILCRFSRAQPVVYSIAAQHEVFELVRHGESQLRAVVQAC